MTGAEFAAIRQRLGLSDDQYADALGLVGRNRLRRIREWKSSAPPPQIADKAKELER